MKIPCYKDWDSLWKYLEDKQLFSFSLNDTTKFEKCSYTVQVAAVYKEKTTGRYWYMDNLHKTHYEVFDHLGKKHIGEAGLDGVIDKTKVDKDKKPIL